MSGGDVTDCRSEQGVLVGLIDGMIASARVVGQCLRKGPPFGESLSEALADFSQDEDIALLCAAGVQRPESSDR